MSRINSAMWCLKLLQKKHITEQRGFHCQSVNLCNLAYILFWHCLQVDFKRITKLSILNVGW